MALWQGGRRIRSRRLPPLSSYGCSALPLVSGKVLLIGAAAAGWAFCRPSYEQGPLGLGVSAVGLGLGKGI